jgi:thioesterase domain-containing protein
MGGVVAYEIAQRLRGAGAQVALLTLVDVGMSPSGERPDMDDPSLLLAFGRDLAGRAGDAGRAGRSWDLEADGDRIRRLPDPDRLDYFLARSQEHGVLPDEMDRTTLGGYFARFRRNHRAMLAYRATRYDGRLLFLRARQEGASVEVARAWSALSTQAEVIDLDGDHHAVMRRDRAPVIAELIGSRLRVARDEAAPPSGAGSC